MGQTSIDTLETEHGTWADLAGGPALYVAVIAAALGLRTALISRVGEDFDRGILERARQFGVDTTGVTLVRGSSTRIHLVYRGAALQRVTVSEGVNSNLRLDRIPSRYFSSKLIHLSPAPFETLVEAAKTFKAYGIPVAFDPHADFNAYPFSRTAMVLNNVTLFFSNADEAKAITKEEEVDAAMGVLRAAGPRIVVVTKGAEGALAVFDNKRTNVEALKPERVVNYLGAGDAFQAGFLVAMLKGYSLKSCLVWGAASATCILGGTGLENVPEPQTIKRVLALANTNLPEEADK